MKAKKFLRLAGLLLLGLFAVVFMYQDSYKYHPKTKQELIKLVRDNNIYLGDIDTSKITDMSGLFWLPTKCEKASKEQNLLISFIFYRI